VDIEKIKSGRPKPVFIISLEWVTLLTLGALILAAAAVQFDKQAQLAVVLLSFILLIEFGLLAILYGMEGIRYKIIWLTYPTLGGPKRIGFRSLGAFLVGAAYILMGLSLIVLALMFVYYNSRPPS
jgi:hypothetical protein